MRASSISAMATRSCSRWKATTTPPTSSPIKGQRRASAASCATCSPWAHARSPTSTPCALARLSIPKTRHLVSGVVAGIGGYGNCVGVPTVGGETNFDAGYNDNILVNAMCVGLARTDKIFYSAAKGVGLPVVYVGSKTGRDGIHGATMASAEFDDASADKRPTVQVGDPFTEKLLIEACLELMATDMIIAIQDMGAAGLTSSTSEMADKGGVGIELVLDHVPQREANMTAYEMMLSESQERMLMILKPGREKDAEKIFTKWGPRLRRHRADDGHGAHDHQASRSRRSRYPRGDAG